MDKADRFTCNVCGAEQPLTARVPHRLKHMSNGRARSAAGTVLQQNPADAREALAVIQELIDEVQ